MPVTYTPPASTRPAACPAALLLTIMLVAAACGSPGASTQTQAPAADERSGRAPARRGHAEGRRLAGLGPRGRDRQPQPGHRPLGHLGPHGGLVDLRPARHARRRRPGRPVPGRVVRAQRRLHDLDHPPARRRDVPRRHPGRRGRRVEGPQRLPGGPHHRRRHEDGRLHHRDRPAHGHHHHPPALGRPPQRLRGPGRLHRRRRPCSTTPSVATTPSAAGPFTFHEWVKGDHVTVVKNPNYWQAGLPHLDQIKWMPIPDSEDRLAALRGRHDQRHGHGDPPDDRQRPRQPRPAPTSSTATARSSTSRSTPWRRRSTT